jgi:hypothetical protein
MAKKIKADLAASIRARLLAKAKAQGRDFNAVLLQYAARIKIQIDVGFGDVVSYAPGLKTFPCLIDLPAPKIIVYSKETAVAEKLDALAKLGLATSRMKDFYDVLYLARNTNFSLQRLESAVRKTFEKRNTEMSLLEGVFSNQWKQDKDKQTQWKSFVERNKLDVESKISDVVDLLKPFISMLLKNEVSANSYWDPKSWSWNFHAS